MAGDDAPLRRLFSEGSDDDIRRFMVLLRPPELADVLERTPEGERLRVLRLMNAPLKSEVLREVEVVEREDILDDLSAGEIAEIVHESKSDDATDFVASLPPEKAERTLQKLGREQRREIKELLEYGEETAGGIMQTEVVTARSDGVVAEAIESVKAADVRDVGEIHEVFVVDGDGRLVGTISPADLLHEEPQTPLRTLLEPNPVSVPVTMDQEKIARIVRENNLATVPVVDEQGVLAGQILHDDIADVIAEEATEDIAKMAGADPEEVYDDSVFAAVRSRAVWLLPAFAGGLLVSVVVGGAEAEISSLPWIAAFLPVILGMAGNVGTQTSAITVRALALGRLDIRRPGRAVRRQVVTGLALGLIFGILLFGFTAMKDKPENPAIDGMKVALAVAISIFTSMTVGATMGVSVPLLVHRLGFDPAIATSPFVQTANDLTGASIALLVVRWLVL